MGIADGLAVVGILGDGGPLEFSSGLLGTLGERPGVAGGVLGSPVDGTPGEGAGAGVASRIGRSGGKPGGGAEVLWSIGSTGVGCGVAGCSPARGGEAVLSSIGGAVFVFSAGAEVPAAGGPSVLSLMDSGNRAPNPVDESVGSNVGLAGGPSLLPANIEAGSLCVSPRKYKRRFRIQRRASLGGDQFPKETAEAAAETTLLLVSCTTRTIASI